jgi:2'-5' RNA ligase
MYGIITELLETHQPQVYQTWNTLISSCGLRPEVLSPFPHVTWLIADDINLPALKEALLQFTVDRCSLGVQASGLGLFTGAQPVIYVPVLKTPHLTRFHKDLWKRVTSLVSNPSAFYAPKNWIPHITLAYGDLFPDEVGCAVQRLAYQPIHLDFTVDHLALDFWDEQAQGGINEKFYFCCQA